MCIRWSTLLWRRKILLTVVMVAAVMVMMMNYQTKRTFKRTLLLDKKDAVTVPVPELQRNDTFIPNYPNQTLVGRPAFIPHRFLIEEADACLRKGREVEVVVYVHSAISRVKKRQQTRLTWASSSALKMVVVFMVGRAKDDTEREIVRRESEQYHDIVQGDYGDYYHLLSYKGLSSLYWITRNCAHVPWTLHADDDILIDTFLLKQFLQVQRDTSDASKLHCMKVRHAKVEREGKWKVTQEEMDAKRYPTYCQGFLWYINTRQLPNLLDASTSVNYLWVDDAYITGCLTREASIGLSDFKKYVGSCAVAMKQVGKMLAWYHCRISRAKLWSAIEHHHGYPAPTNSSTWVKRDSKKSVSEDTTT